MDTAGTTCDEVTQVISGVSSTGLKARLGDKYPFNKSCENSASANLAQPVQPFLSLRALPTLIVVSTQAVSDSFQDV